MRRSKKEMLQQNYLQECWSHTGDFGSLCYSRQHENGNETPISSLVGQTSWKKKDVNVELILLFSIFLPEINQAARDHEDYQENFCLQSKNQLLKQYEIE